MCICSFNRIFSGFRSLKQSTYFIKQTGHFFRLLTGLKETSEVKIPMDDALVMQIFNCSYELTGVKLSTIDGLVCQFGDELEQITILGISQHEIESLLILKLKKIWLKSIVNKMPLIVFTVPGMWHGAVRKKEHLYPICQLEV
jgi:hypothetical protein